MNHIVLPPFYSDESDTEGRQVADGAVQAGERLHEPQSAPTAAHNHDVHGPVGRQRGQPPSLDAAEIADETSGSSQTCSKVGVQRQPWILLIAAT